MFCTGTVIHLMQDRQTVLFSATQTKKVNGLLFSLFKLFLNFLYWCQCLCVVIPQVEDFANITFGKNEERQRKLVYVGVDDSEFKVWNCLTMLLSSLLNIFRIVL